MLGTKLWSSARTVHASECGGISPVQKPSFSIDIKIKMKGNMEKRKERGEKNRKQVGSKGREETERQ